MGQNYRPRRRGRGPVKINDMLGEDGSFELSFPVTMLKNIIRSGLYNMSIHENINAVFSDEEQDGIRDKCNQWLKENQLDISLDEFYEPDDLVRSVRRRNGSKTEKNLNLFLSEEYIRLLESRDKKQTYSKEDIRKDPKYQVLKKFFNISIEEMEILWATYYLFQEESNNKINTCFDHSEPEPRRIAACLGISSKKVLSLLKEDLPLLRLGLLDNDDFIRRKDITLTREIVGFLSGFYDENSLYSEFFKVDKKNALPISFYPFPKDDLNLMEKLLKSRGAVNILFYGKPGTGKTELARTLAKRVKKRVLFVNQGGSDGRGKKVNRQLALESALNISYAGDILVVDEADMLLNTKLFLMGSIDKGWINDFLDRSNIKIIWITNKISRVEDSVLRRFHFNYHFDSFNLEQRKSVWKKVVKKHEAQKLIPNNLQSQLAEKYQINAAGIEIAVETLKKLILPDSPIDEEEVESTLSNILASHQTLITGKKPEEKKKPQGPGKEFEAALVHTDRDMKQLDKVIEGFLSNSAEEREKGLNLLFWGIPGTGKTEYVKNIAASNGKKLIYKSYSDLESKWVGETEKNIARAFEEAKKQDAVLFIDEADSFFTERESARASWEVSRTNELLMQMEKFNGVFVCCTNLLKLMDKAAMRRFHFKVQFKPTKPKDIPALFLRFFNSGKKLSDSEKKELVSLEGVTPGDMAAVFRQFEYLSDEEKNYSEIIGALKSELQYKNADKTSGVIGFTGA